MLNLTTSSSLLDQGVSTEAPAVVEDAVFGNDSTISTNWTGAPLGCSSWKLPNHPLFQAANVLLMLGLLCPQWKHGVLVMHGSFSVGFLVLSVWAWMILCAPDYFSWNFAFMLVNMVQTLTLLYGVKPVKFDESMEKLYTAVFQPMNVSRQLFKKLTDENFCMVTTLYEGDAYAAQGITKTDRLGLLVTGTMKVYNQNNLLHLIHEREFIDSPEFESSVTGEEKFQVSSYAATAVSIYAATSCKYIYWPRQSLEYLLMKEPFLANVLNTIMGRDITNKLYALNSRVKETDRPTNNIVEESRVTNSVPLTPVPAPVPAGRTCDLRRTLALVSSKSFVQGRLSIAPNVDHSLMEEEQEEIEGPYSVTEEEVNLIPDSDSRKNGGDRRSTDSPAKSSIHSYHSGIHFNVSFG